MVWIEIVVAVFIALALYFNFKKAMAVIAEWRTILRRRRMGLDKGVSIADPFDDQSYTQQIAAFSTGSDSADVSTGQPEFDRSWFKIKKTDVKPSRRLKIAMCVYVLVFILIFLYAYVTHFANIPLD